MVSRSRSGERKRKRRRPNIYTLLQRCVPQQCQGFILPAEPRPVYVSPVCFSRADHGWAVRVLHLDPVPRRTGPIGRAHPFRDDAFEAHLATPFSGQRPTATFIKASCRSRSKSIASSWATRDRRRASHRHLEHRVPDAVRIAVIRHRFRKPPAHLELALRSLSSSRQPA
jgi:hypothetical protein